MSKINKTKEKIKRKIEYPYSNLHLPIVGIREIVYKSII